MRFFLDENLEGMLAAPLRSVWYEATTVREQDLGGRVDTLVAQARRLQSTLISCDLGLANVQNYPLGSHSGIVVLRLGRLTKSEFIDRALAALTLEIGDDLVGCLAIVDNVKTRIRRP